MPPQPTIHLAAIRQPAFLHGSDGRIAVANDLAEALAGRPLAGCTAADIIAIFGNRHPDGRTFTPEELPPSQALAGEEAVDVPITVTAADGRTVHILATASPIRENDEIAGALVVWQDVSALEAARAEQSRLHLEAEGRADELASVSSERGRHRHLLDTILGTLPYRVSLWSRDERLAWANMLFAEDLGEPREALVGRTWRELGDSVAAVEPLVRKSQEAIMAGMTVSREIEIDGPGGSEWRACTFLPFGRDALLVITEDVTGKKRADEALRESAERLRLAQESASVAVWDWDVRTGLYTSTPEFFRLYGLEEGRTLTYGQWRERVHPDDVAWIETESQAALARGEPFDFEHRIVRPSGETRWIQGIGRGVCDEQGEVVRVLGVNIDITVRKAAERVLAETAEQYRQALNNPLLGYALCEIVTDGAGSPRDFVYLDVNPAFEAFTGLSRDRVLNRRVTEILAPGEVAELIQIYGHVALTGEPRTFQHSIPSLGRSYEVAAFSPHHGRFIAFFKDITKRTSAENALAESEAKYRNLVELAPDAIMIHQDGTIVFANPAAVAMLGFGRPDDLIGRAVLEIVHPGTRDPVEWNIEADLRGEESPLTGVDLVRPDGTTVTVQGRGAMIPFRGRPAIQVILRDVTEEKRAEEELRRSNEELRRFAYVASHDLQEPLRPIISFSQLLALRYKGRLDEDADDYINFIVEGGNRMQSLIQDLLQFSQLETRALPLGPTGAVEAVADALRNFEMSLRESNGTVEVGDLPVVRADRRQLEQVFANLVSNAIKYRRREVPLEVRISAERENGWWRFAVSDNGIGIEEEYYDRIFEMFRRLHTHDKFSGTGIGLAVVKKIVERHRGRIWVESTPGEGSTFFFTLPAA